MQLDIADGKITKIVTQAYVFCSDAYDLGTTLKGNFFAAVSLGTAKATKGELVLIPVNAVQAIHLEVENAKQQNAIESAA
jgi:hypothetical protein